VADEARDQRGFAQDPATTGQSNRAKPPPDRNIEVPMGELAMRHRSSRMSHIIRGSVVVGLLVLAVGSVLFEAGGLQYSVTAQAVLGTIGILTGAVIGARESV
jgi:hypothetical protein